MSKPSNQQLGIKNVIWTENLTTTSPVLATIGKGYTAEGSVVSIIQLPITGGSNPPSDGDLVGVSADGNSSLLIQLEGGASFSNILQNQSSIYRFDVSKDTWLVVSSHLPEEELSVTTVYVDGFGVAGGNGTITMPFNDMITARDFVIGTGTANNPQYQDIIINVVAGVFNYTGSDNFFIESATYNFVEGVEMNISSGSGYTFDNTISTASPSIFTITGKLNWESTTQNAGFILAVGRNESSTSSTNRTKIEAEFKDAINRTDNNTDGFENVPVVSTYCNSTNVSHNNAYSDTIVCNFERISSHNASSVIFLGFGSLSSFTGNTISQFWTSSQNNKSDNRVIIADGCFRVVLNDISIGGSFADYVMEIKNQCTIIEFNNINFIITGSTSSNLKNDHLVRVMSTYTSSIRNFGSSNYINGIFFTECTVLSDNFNTTNPYIILPEIASTPIAVDFDRCVFSIDISPDINVGFYEGNPSIQGTPTTSPSRQNTIKSNITYYNLPTSSSGLNSGALWNDAGTLKLN